MSLSWRAGVHRYGGRPAALDGGHEGASPSPPSRCVCGGETDHYAPARSSHWSALVIRRCPSAGTDRRAGALNALTSFSFVEAFRTNSRKINHLMLTMDQEGSNPPSCTRKINKLGKLGARPKSLGGRVEIIEEFNNEFRTRYREINELRLTRSQLDWWSHRPFDDESDRVWAAHGAVARWPQWRRLY
jgi:hypothetical protein